MSLASAPSFRSEACDRVRGFLGPANSSLRAHEGPSCKYLPFAENNFSLPSLIYRHIPKAGSSTAQMLLWKLWTHVVDAAARPSPAVASIDGNLRRGALRIEHLLGAEHRLDML